MSLIPQPLTVKEQAVSSLSAVPDKLDVEIYGDIARCPSCTRLIGTVQGRCLHTGEVIMITGTVLRCRSCKSKLKWTPPYFKA